MAKSSVYLQLSQFLQKHESNNLTMKFEEIETIIHRNLPPSARKYQAWWGNCYNQKSRHCQAWLEYGWVQESLDIANEIVTFRRNKDAV
ncbi:hypothetical protein CBW65_18685 [Tumebacillus avium]|uniref:DUF7662 domain-containing protein n=1 Tax=Tumebacillus avium TaxID=1903704 RepID=A0A1Y0IRY6_9BACL|nr:hypothetical protein [Tumebacillus avium]ARU62769.1 hypothetical protein CBW65_18685 [Tumebacillus avium]